MASASVTVPVAAVTAVGKAATMTEPAVTVAAVTMAPITLMTAMAAIMVTVSGSAIDAMTMSAIDAMTVMATMPAIAITPVIVVQTAAVIGVANIKAESEIIRDRRTGRHQSQDECGPGNDRFDSHVHDQSSAVGIGTHLERYYIDANLNWR